MDLTPEIELFRRVGKDIDDEQDFNDFYDHGLIVSTLAGRVAKELGCDEKFCEEIQVAGMLHDIGKLQLARYIYGHGEDILDVEEVKYVRMHPTLGHELLRKEGTYSESIISYIANHHENFDGSGYPNHLEGNQIPYGARILRVCDVFAALVSNRPYRDAFPIDTAIEMMIDDVKDFDMQVFLAFLTVVHEDDFSEVEQMIARARRHSKYRMRKSETT